MQADQKPVIWSVVIASIVLALILVGGFFSVGNKIENQLSIMNQKVANIDVDEQAIANAIVTGIVMPEMPEIPEFPAAEKLDELWDEVYSNDVEILKSAAENVTLTQLEEDNEGYYSEGEGDTIRWFLLEGDAVYDLVTDGVDCDGDCVVEFVKEYDGRVANVINLGLGDDFPDSDDRLVELSSVIRVKVFTDEDDSDEYFFDKVYIDAVVTSDDKVLEAEVSYTL